jgi:hypothetical protein
MHVQYKPRVFILVLISMIIGLSTYISYDRISSASNQQAVDLAIVDDLLRSMKQASAYRLMPDSIMTGLCWYGDDGSREGIFKDVNAGVAQWRERQPEAVKQDAQGAAAADDRYHSLSNALTDLSFEATDYTVKEGKAEITGIIQVANHKQKIVLDVDLPVETMPGMQHEPVALKAVTEINSEKLLLKYADSDSGPVNLCLMMQVARGIDTWPSSSEKPMQLSQFY